MECWQIIYLIHIMSYWGVCSYYDNLYINIKNLDESVKGSIKNQIFITLPFIYLFFQKYPIEYNNLIVSVSLLPFLISSADIYFYMTHRFAHKYLWFIHKYHHRGKNFAVKSLDAHMLEHLFCNLGSIIFGIYLLKYLTVILNIYVICLWICLITINTCLTHTELYDNNGDHLIHHKYLHFNYGIGFYTMDKFFGTYKHFSPLVKNKR